MCHISLLGAKFFEPNELDIVHFDKVDTTANMLFGRTQTHRREKVMDSHHDHYTLQLFEANIPRLAAMVVLADQVLDNLDPLNNTDCMLRHPQSTAGSSFQEITQSNGIGDNPGCYLFYDDTLKIWRRSGKVSGRSILERLKEHSKSASTVGTRGEESSQLYFKYPSKDSPLVRNNQNTRCWTGFYEDLVPYAGITHDVFNNLDFIARDDDGLLDWKLLPQKHFDAANKLGDTPMAKRLSLFSFMLELTYDLMLSRTDNLSVMAGFESAGLMTKK